jgi:polyhydroxyalkanoate synthesis regulator phasin
MAKLPTKWLALLGGAVITAGSLFAQDSGPLIDLLVKKGIVTDQEAEQLRADLVKDFAANTSAGKLNLSSSLTELRISGDVRVRYEYRQAQNLAGDNVDRGRFRYRLRPTITGQLGSNWFFGFRLENSTGSRSSNVTMGDDAGPFAKTNDAVYIGQVYLGYRPNANWTIYAGRIPNPFVNTLLVWDGDINPEGFAEQFKKTEGNTTYFVNLGQFLYDSANPQNSIAPAITRQDQYMLGWQAGATFKLNETDTLQFAPTIYHYLNNKPTSKTFAGAFSPANTTAINNLFILDMPFEYNFTLPGAIPNRIFGDIAYNAAGKDRARKFGRPDLDNQVYAWQLGYQYGKAKLKREWDAKLYYQETGLFALDPNLVDSDLFDSRTNMKGLIFTANYMLSDAITFTLTYANGATKNKTAVSAGLGDIGITTFNKFNLLQFDVVAKF